MSFYFSAFKFFALSTFAMTTLVRADIGGVDGSQTGIAAYKYDEKTNQLYLPYVDVGGKRYLNAVIRIDAAKFISAELETKAVGLPASCGSTILDPKKFDAIKVGMTMDQVNALLGCQYDPWSISPRLYYESASAAPSIYMEFTWRFKWLGTCLCQNNLVSVLFDRQGKYVEASKDGDFKYNPQ